MNAEVKSAAKAFVLELVLYAALVTAYFFLVLHLLSDRLYTLFLSSRIWYTVIALALIIFQGVFLEALTRYLVNLFHRPPEEEDL